MSSLLFCPVCRQPLVTDAAGQPVCSGCTVSYQLVPAPSATTLSLPADGPPPTVDDASPGEATLTYHPPHASEPRDERAPPGYEILGELGRGGMGVVYRAKHLRLDRLCALKMILAGGHAGERERKRFETEARAIARLQHPGIVQVFEVGEHQGHPFMALELCEGGSLDARLRDQPPTAQQAATMVRDLAVAMQAAHEAKVIHRDLKPGNVLITSDGTLKVTDFGLAKKLDDDDGQTRTGAIMGTPSYMPPEQAEGKKDITPVADVYALGAILYATLTGRPPFRGATPMETVMQVLEKEPVPVQELNPSVPADLATIAHKCLHKEPGRRYGSARELAADLGRFLAGEPILARPVGRLERAVKWVRRNPIVSALTTAVILVLTAGIVVSWLYASKADRQAKEAGEKTREANDNATWAREEAERATRQEANAMDRLRRMELANYASKLLLAQAAFNGDNMPAAFRHLDACQWDLRSWEHAHLRRKFDSSTQTLKGHTGRVTSVCFSPDGQRILTGSWDGTAKLWDADKGTEIRTLKGHASTVTSVSFSPDGKRILTGSDDGTATVWDAETDQEVLTLRGHTGHATSVAWSPDGKRILTGGSGRSDFYKAESGGVGYREG